LIAQPPRRNRVAAGRQSSDLELAARSREYFTECGIPVADANDAYGDSFNRAGLTDDHSSDDCHVAPYRIYDSSLLNAVRSRA
jgi:hypothetical protein